MAFTIKVNGVDRTVDVDGDTPLLWVLRDVLGMTGTKFGCGAALCGVHRACRWCRHPFQYHRYRQLGTSEITTIEAIGATVAGAEIQKAWLDREVVQSGRGFRTGARGAPVCALSLLSVCSGLTSFGIRPSASQSRWLALPVDPDRAAGRYHPDVCREVTPSEGVTVRIPQLLPRLARRKRLKNN